MNSEPGLHLKHSALESVDAQAESLLPAWAQSLSVALEPVVEPSFPLILHLLDLVSQNIGLGGIAPPLCLELDPNQDEQEPLVPDGVMIESN